MISDNCPILPPSNYRIYTLGLSSMTQWNADEYLTQYLSSQVLAQDTPQMRIAFWHFYQAGSRHLKRWITNLPLEEQEKYRPFVLPYPTDPHELTRLCDARKTHYERQEKRKEETDAIMPFYAQLRTHAHLRYNLLTRLRKAYRKAIKPVPLLWKTRIFRWTVSQYRMPSFAVPFPSPPHPTTNP